MYNNSKFSRMVVCKDLEDIQDFDASILTIGSLDGIHRGHIEIISALTSLSNLYDIPSVVITFDPHPQTVLKASEQSMQILLSIDKKIDFFEKHTVNYVWVIPFDKKFSKISAGQFLEMYIASNFSPLDIIIGSDHHFGFNREGGREFLNKNKEAYGYNLHVQEPVFYQDIPISSSRIRRYLSRGNIDQVNDCLGWEYEFSGTIVKGQGRGSILNFPTANICPHISNQLLPAHGVYCVDAIIEDSYYTGMCNIGQRPTFYENGEEIIEVHLFLNDELTLYEKEISLKFKKYLREERKYNSSNELIKQLELDRQACFAI